MRIPHENIIGQVNAGWGPMMTTLANERTLIGSSQSMVKFDDIVAFARHSGVAGDPTIRQELIRQLSLRRDHASTWATARRPRRRVGV